LKILISPHYLKMKLKDYKPKYVQLKNPITSIEQINNFGIADTKELSEITKDAQIPFPILTNEYYLNLADSNDKNDPIRQIVVPTKEELEIYFDSNKNNKGSFDTSGEKKNVKANGLQHKYQPTALALVSNVCASLCRECFRKRLFFEGNCNVNETTFPNEEALDYLKKHKEINTILLSGGDALMLKDESIKEILEILSDIDHITTVRFGTKVHAFYPTRITDNLCQILADFTKKTGKAVHVCAHFEHVNEISKECIASLELMRKYGIEMYNQTVLLKGINDNAKILYDLFQKIAVHGVRPYYLFQCRPVFGTLHQQIKLKEGIRIYSELMQLMSGIHKPRYAMSTKIGKMEILGVNPTNSDEVILKLHSAKDIDKTGDIIFYNVKENNPYWYDA